MTNNKKINMRNDKQSMKLYTEEQIKEAIKIALHGFGIGGIEDTIEVVASKFIPIQLPSKEIHRQQILKAYKAGWEECINSKYLPATYYEKTYNNQQ